MNQLGMGVLIGMLGSNKDSVSAFKAAVGKEITALSLDEEELVFTFTDSSKMKLFDDGQSCCEERYMHSNDDIQAFIGAKLISAEVRDVTDIDSEYGVHEVAFLIVTTSLGVFTVETHNIHNGYYGGFLIRAAVV